MERSDCSKRIRVLVNGAVQGVGFRPFVFRLAEELGLSGSVLNSASGVVIEVEGSGSGLESFLSRLEKEKPGPALIRSLKIVPLPGEHSSGFRILESRGGTPSTLIPPDLAVCPLCAGEVLDPLDRRFRYPFTNCTNCGPRYSIILSLPYDRPGTTMGAFPMCPLCRGEYTDPGNRRFHAQPVACPDCGPELTLLDGGGGRVAGGDAALRRTVEALLEGGLVALKGLGGFQLLARADSDRAVGKIRHRKRRPHKPMAIMVKDADAAELLCFVNDGERALLVSPAAPITLMRWRGEGVSKLVAPESRLLGVMLPATPLHLLLLSDAGVPLVATSGNSSGEPMCIDDTEALERLGGIADLFLTHNRPIARQMDDSVAAVLPDGPLVIRRARGYVPLPIPVPGIPAGVAGVGGHLANTGAISVEGGVVLSQHIGDLDSPGSIRAHRAALDDLSEFFGPPVLVARDSHPDYGSSIRAGSWGLPVTQVQHHLAHVMGCMAENGLDGPVLGVAWDGTGLGTDLTPWGGEFILAEKDGSWERVAHLRGFPLPGGDAAALEPRRSALGILWELFRSLDEDFGFNGKELGVLAGMMARGVNSPRTTSAGRLFDGVACLCGVARVSSYRGQAPSILENLASEAPEGAGYPLSLTLPVLDWEPMIRNILSDLSGGVPVAVVARRFHHGLAEGIVRVARAVRADRVALTGGCFNNALLTTLAIRGLADHGFRPFRHRLAPPGDGGLALGQVAAATGGK